MKQRYVRQIPIILVWVLLLSQLSTKAQAPCMPTVPSYTVNLTGSPAGVWTSPNVSRNDQCCGVLAPNQCIYFYLTLDPNAAGIQIDMIGADPAGSLFYNIGCTGNYPGGTIKCINGVGPHAITFCKPGGNANIYKITSISKPLFPKDDTVRLGCKHKFVTLGIVNSSVTWQSIYPGTPGQYNSYLDSTNVASPTYSSGTGAPAYIDYKVCGFPIASGCGYSLTVCDTIRIYNFPKLTASVTPNPATFCNAGPGSGVNITASASGGAPSYSYTWKNTASVTVGTGPNYYATTAGNYNVEVKDILYDPLECPSAFTVVSVSQGTVPTVDAGPNQKKCASSPLATLNGSVQFASGGQWTGGAGTYTPGNNYLNTAYLPSAAELSAGFVKLYLTTTGAGGSCTNKKDSVYIYYAQPLIATIPSASIACYNGTTTINSNVSGGTLPYSYLWNNGSTNSSIAAGQGNFSLLVTDSLGCTANANINLVSPAPLNLTFNVTNVTVNGGNDGSATVTPSGGTSAYTVTWTPGSSNNFTLSNLVYGVYTATVTDANGCKITGSKVVNEPRCLGFTASSSATNVLCNGDANGAATVTVSGGTPVYTYTWNTVPAQHSASATNLNAGVFSVIISDANSCFQTANVTITEPSQLTNVMTHTNATIIGGNNGAAAANPFGGTTPYSYLWNIGATTSSVTGLTAGSYSVTVTDNKGCSKSDNVTITQPPCNGLTLNIFKNNVSCFGGSNGSALAVVSGANGSYTVNWSTGATGPSVSNLIAGNYSVMVTNSSNCSEYVNFTITQPSQLSIGLMPVNVSCNGNGNGSIDLSISGGTYPYSYSWNNGSNQEDLVYLTPGTYSVSIVDANGCQAIGSTGITQPAPFNVTYTTQNVSCIYGSNGSIGLNVVGGTSPFTYTWSTGANTQSVSGLTAGGYSVTIKDANNCTLSQPLIIPLTQPDSVKVDSFIVACSTPGSNQTLVNVIPQGGTPGSYQVSFNNGATFQPAGVYTSLLSNNTTYSIVLKDANNCTSLVSDLLSIPAEVKIDSVSFAKCYAPGTSSTNVTVYPSGGATGLYSASFVNGTSYLSAGVYSASLNIATSYSIIVKDSRGCISATQNVTIPALLAATTSITSNYNGQNISCFGLSNGSASVIANGGTAPYNYLWSGTPGQIVANATNLSAGNYSVTVKDANNCAATKTLTLSQPAAVTITAQATSNYNGQQISCFGLSDGSAAATIAGGTAPFSFNWNSVPPQTSASASNLSAGVYSVTASDINGCMVVSSVTLSQAPAINATTSVTSNYNGQNISCFGLSDGAAVVTASGGNGAYSYTWSTIPTQLTAAANNLSSGTYSVTVKDVNNCAITSTVSVSEPSAISATAAIASNYNGQSISCFGLTDGSASVTATGGNGAYTYSWTTTPSQTSSVAANLGAGNYSVSITDMNGCNFLTSVSLTQPSPLTSTAAVTSNYNGVNISCFGLSNGSAIVNANGGTGVYTYTWSGIPTQTVVNATNLSAGYYTITVMDANNCLSSSTVALTEPIALSSTVTATSNYNGQNISCNGLSDGSASVTVTGGTMPFNYSWNSIPTQTTAVAGSLSAGVYSVTATDINGCTVVNSVMLTQPAAISATASITSNFNGQAISCFGLSDGTASVSTAGGNGTYTYSWSTTPAQTGPSAINLSAGNYSVTVTDVNNCSVTKTVTVTQPNALSATASVSSNYNGQNISCFGQADGSASVTVNGGNGGYTYTWTTVPSQSTTTATNLLAGTYTVNVSDVNGCFSTASVVINQPAAVNPVISSLSNFNGYNVSCFGSTNGYIDISLTGGTGAYTYSWTNGASTQDINTLGGGQYSVIATDVNGCVGTLSVALTQPTQLLISLDSLSNFNGFNIQCKGLANGTVFATPVGGVPSYSYLWSNGSNSQNLANAGAGTYTLTVVDQNNCTSIIDTVLTEPSPIALGALVTSPLCNGVANGAIDVTTSGGVNPFVYVWSNGATTEDINNIAAGTYTVYYTDKNNCKDSAAISVLQPQPLAVTKTITAVKCYGDTTGAITLALNGGVVPYVFQWSNAATTSSISNLQSGTYTVTVTDANGCLVKDTTILSQPDSLYITLSSPLQFDNHNISFPGGSDGSITLTANGGVLPYSYLWSNSSSEQNQYNVNAGLYSVTLVDNNGCRVSGSITLTEPLNLEMPSGFSPNNDGKNDVFNIHGIEAYPQNSITIFNRWGNILYEKSGYNNEWIGQSKNGMQLPDATYFVILEINAGEKVLKGFVELRR